MPAPPSLTIHEDTPCPGFDGSCSDWNSDAIYIAPGASQLTRLHEIGHQFDRQVLTDADRDWFRRLFRYPAGTVWDAERTSEPFVRIGVAETFADAYALCGSRIYHVTRRNGIRVYERTVEINYMPSLRQHRQACNAIAVIALVRLDQR